MPIWASHHPLRPRLNVETHYSLQAIAVVVPAFVSIKEVLTGGNLILATIAGALAVGAGVWAYRKQRTQAETALLEKLKAELEYTEALGRATRRPPAKR